MSQFRVVTDSMGDVSVPADAKFSAQTQRALDNFQISSLTLPDSFIDAVLHIKRAAAEVNTELGVLDAEISQAIIQAVDRVLAGEFRDQFPVDVFQTGSGTSTNMNVNEVVATLASEMSGLSISANDHVNMSQSSNDVVPTAIHCSAAIKLQEILIPAVKRLQATIDERAGAMTGVVKTGRTHLMDAMPMTLAQEMSAWSCQLEKAQARLQHVLSELRLLSQGGTAVGTGVNAPQGFSAAFCEVISRNTHTDFRPNNNFFEGISCQDTAVSASSQLKTLAVALTKISNDLRWMNSGPLSGLGEIQLRALQPGSSIMPGKVNPVIPEAVAMACAQVVGNDACIAMAGQSGNFQLNVMLPVIAYNLLQSTDVMASSCTALADQCIVDFQVNHNNLQAALAKNPVLVTALNPLIGYLKAAEIAKRAYSEQRDILDVAEEMTTYSREELLGYLDPERLTRGGLHA
ncbi:class II fumarate hydratase [Spongiibacter sp. UBA1325]|uniref:class II fumarate hydratase n=1 Tax=Spongiibacter TaxID=630749 RepID=UPI00257988C9|nr:class II fumarate hydratase [Spongiibacter sp. UBA1325]|tara:strand:+ start:1703 stop:3085 length:1383 start_codon:yes stop_codon:yes gene_type:complete